MRGYKCRHKTAKKILESLGFDPHDANRGWTMNRTGGKNNKGAPVRMHAIIQADDEGEYIDVHADYLGPNGTHITSRGGRVTRWNQLFGEIDRDEICFASQKLLAHYGSLGPALEKYHGNKGKRRKTGLL